MSSIFIPRTSPGKWQKLPPVSTCCEYEMGKRNVLLVHCMINGREFNRRVVWSPWNEWPDRSEAIECFRCFDEFTDFLKGHLPEELRDELLSMHFAQLLELMAKSAFDELPLPF